MRLPAIVLLACWSISSTAGEQREFRIPPDFDYEQHFSRLAANPPHMSVDRLPKGYQIGRCLLVVDDRTRISGPCAYIIHKGGDFHIAGPRQVYDGIDYPKAEITAASLSTDYWADVFKDEDGNWTGYSNEDVRSVKGEGSSWGGLVRRGACYSNGTKPPKPDEFQQLVKVCLWKK